MVFASFRTDKHLIVPSFRFPQGTPNHSPIFRASVKSISVISEFFIALRYGNLFSDFIPSIFRVKQIVATGINTNSIIP